MDSGKQCLGFHFFVEVEDIYISSVFNEAFLLYEMYIQLYLHIV